MKNKSILFKSVICGLIYLVFLLSIIWVVYILDSIEATFILGTLYAIIIAVIAYCNKIKRMVITFATSILSAAIMQVLLSLLGIPYRIILFIYRNDEWVKESGRLSVNESVGLAFGTVSFWSAMIMSLIILSIVSAVLISHKNMQ